ncbi:MAG: hypothetical protein KDK36_20180 [Leptospiraceae bacterium]|nr:hypothetical protein [Leptospiraceae bacterium]
MNQIVLFFLATFSLIVSIIGILMTIIQRNPKDFGNGISISLFFLMCAIVLFYSIYSDQKIKKELEIPIEKISIEGGRKIYFSKFKIYSTGFILFISFGIISYFSSINKIFTFITFGVSILGGVVIILALTGIIGKQFISFEENGLRIGDKKGSFLLNWDNFFYSLEEWNNNHFIFFTIHNYNLIEWQEGSINKDKLLTSYYKAFGTNRNMMGCDYFFNPSHYGFSPAIFYRAVEIFVKDPHERFNLAELKKLAEK